MPHNPKYQRLQVQYPRDWQPAIKAAAAEYNVSQSQIWRAAMYLYLRGRGQEVEGAVRTPGRPVEDGE